MARNMPIMKNSDWAKLPYLWTLYVRVSPIAIARYVDDQVRVLVPIETKSRVTVASSLSPWKSRSRDRKTMTSKNSGERSMAALRAILGFTSSNKILMKAKPADIASTNCRSHTKSFGSPPATILSI